MTGIDNVKTSQETKELFSALCRAQAAIHHASKDSKNPHFKSSYASLESAIDSCKPHLNSNNICLIQVPGAEGRLVWVDTMLVHTSGQFIQGRLTIEAKGSDAHSVGGTITYARRYSILAFMGMGAEDDDGNLASGKPSPPVPVVAKEDGKKELRERLGKLMEEKGWSADQVQTLMLKVFGVKASALLKVDDFKILINMLETKTYKEALAEAL
jgi:hypothetical protein